MEEILFLMIIIYIFYANLNVVFLSRLIPTYFILGDSSMLMHIYKYF